MDILVAGLAERNSVGDIVARAGMVFPRLDVMRLYLAHCAALLACVFVALKDGVAPLPIFVGVALLVAICLAGSQTLAFARTILGVCMAADRRERRAAPLAYQDCPLPLSRARQLASARQGAAFFAPAKFLSECLVANRADSDLARVATVTPGIGGEKYTATIFARSFFGYPARRCVHGSIIPLIALIASLQRWADATGKTPVRVERDGTPD